MPTLVVTLKAHRMPNSTQLFRMAKAVEHLYYGILLSSSSYAESDEFWLGWLQMGFAAGLKEPPPSRKADRLVRTVRSDGPTTEVRVTSDNGVTLDALAMVLRDLEGLRVSVQGQPDAERGRALLATEPLNKQLVRPIEEALSHVDLRQSEVNSFVDMIRGSLVALTDDDLISLNTDTR